MQEQVRAVGDVSAVAVVVGTLVHWLPPIAALLTIVWTGLRIWEMVSGKPVGQISWIAKWFRNDNNPSK